jgi:type II secretory pathway pseudopilin PulG
MKASAKSPRGATLIELMVVIALMTLVFSGSATLLTAVMRSQGMLWADIQQQSARARLAVQLRTDAHGSISVQSLSPQVCEFRLENGGTVHYEVKESSLHRELRRQDAVPEREAFPLNGLTAAFFVDDSRQLPLVRLNLESVSEAVKYSPIARSSVLEAAVGTQTPLPAKRSEP